jgi:hypothetical protein
MKTPQHPLVGRFFHSFYGPHRLVEWQGEILAVTDQGVLVQLFEWFLGESSAQRWVPLAKVEQWDLYPSNEHMHEAYEQRHRLRAEQAARENLAQQLVFDEKNLRQENKAGPQPRGNGEEHPKRS